MASATANPSATNLGSAKPRRPSRAPPLPWTQAVRGGESESNDVVHEEDVVTSTTGCFPPMHSSSASPDDFTAVNQPESSDNGDGDGNAGKKPAWKNKPSNKNTVEVGLVMGAVSWPALSDSTRVSTKSPPESSKVPVPVDISPVLASQKQTTNNANPNSTPNNSHYARQRSSKRSGGGSLSASNNMRSQGPVTSGGGGVESPRDNASFRDHAHKGTTTNWESGQRGSQSHTGQGHPQQRSSFRRGNGGPYPRGDGSYHHNYGGRRDHDRGNHDWNPHRTYNGRDAHLQPQRVVPRGFVAPPQPAPHTSPFVTSPPVRPFGSHMGFEMASTMVYIPHELFRGVPFMAPIPPPAMIFPAMDPQLHAKIVTQIDYYFSNENLIKDTYLRQNMDDQGWVPIKLIAGFNKVRNLTDNMQLILDALRASTIVEVQGDKVRKRNDWMKWIMQSIQFTTVSGSQLLGRSSHDMLASRVRDVALEETTNHSSTSGKAAVHAETLVSRSSSGDLYNHAQTSGTAEMGQCAPQTGSGSSIPSRNAY